MSVSPQHNPISPPTPAPSPRPELHSLLPSLAAAAAANGSPSSQNRSSIGPGPSPLATSTTFPIGSSTDSTLPLDLISQLLSTLPLGQSSESDVAILLALLGRVYPTLSTSPKLKSTFLSSLVSLCTLSDLTQLSSMINPRLKLDFFTSLPIEVSLLCLSFIDDPKTLARAMQVSTRWKELVEDEGTWKGMCEKHRFEMGEDQEDDDEDGDTDEVQNDQSREQEERRQDREIAMNTGTADEDQEMAIHTDQTPRPMAAFTPSNQLARVLVPSTESTSSTSSYPPSSSSSSSTPSTSTSLPNPSVSSSESQAQAQSLLQISADISKSTQDSIASSLKLRFAGNGLDPDGARHDLKFFYEQVNLHKTSVDQEKWDLMNWIELIVREECESRFGGLRADINERKSSSARDVQDHKDDDSMDLDVDYTSQSHSAKASNASRSAKFQGLGKGRPSPSPFQRNQSLKTAGGRTVSFENGLGTRVGAGSEFGQGRSSSTSFNGQSRNGAQKRTFSYRTHFKLAYLTESNWLRGGRLLTQHTSSDNGAVVTSLALDSEWIVVGMANSKIHVFDSKTGLFSKTLQGHESGVWCLCLVSKTEGVEKVRERKLSSKMNLSSNSISSSASTPDRTGSTATSTTNGTNQRVENDLKLIHHDKRKNASPFSSHEDQNHHNANKLVQNGPQLSHPRPTYPVNANGSRLAKDLVERIGQEIEGNDGGRSKLSAPTFDGLKSSGNVAKSSKGRQEQTQETDDSLDPLVFWFFKIKDYLYQEENSAKSSYNRLRKSSPNLATTSTLAQEKGMEAARAEAEAGQIRDSIMRNDGKVPMEFRHLTGEGLNQERTSGDKGQGKGKKRDVGKVKKVPTAPTTSFANFGPFNAGIEGELGIGGDPHYVDENGMAVDENIVRGLQEHVRRQNHGDNEASDEENQDQQSDSLVNDEGDDAESFLQRPYSPSDYRRAFGEEFNDDDEFEISGGGDAKVENSNDTDVEMKPFHLNKGKNQILRNDRGKSASTSTASASSQQRSTRPNPRSESSRDNSHLLTGSSKGFGNKHALVISGACDRTVRVWDLRTGSCKHILKGHTSTVRCLKVLDGRPLAISGSRDSTLRVWDIKRGCLVHLLSGHQDSVRCIEVHGTRVVSGSYDCTARIWNALDGKCLNILRGHFHQIYAVAFDGRIVATGSLDSTVRVYDAENGKCLAVLQGHTSLVGQLQLTNSILITGGSDGRVIIFCLKTFQCLHRLCAHDNSVTCLQFDDKFIVTGGNDGKVKLWNFKTGAFIREICEPSEQVWKVSYKDDKCVVLCKREGKTSMDVITFRPPIEEL